uniref:Ovule protein n=1 Tax=Parascaris univalens TaxID=6257 RepID=A0A915CDD2_PARUN
MMDAWRSSALLTKLFDTHCYSQLMQQEGYFKNIKPTCGRISGWTFHNGSWAIPFTPFLTGYCLNHHNTSTADR